MQIVAHRVNDLEKFDRVPENIGMEIDIRIGHIVGNTTSALNLILTHDIYDYEKNQFIDAESFENFLTEYANTHKDDLLILNTKTTGIEKLVLDMVRKAWLTNYFLLDVEFPYLNSASRKGERAIAIRYSENEGMDTVLKYKGLVDRVWIDTCTKLPLDVTIIEQLKGFKTALVCPERRWRPQDIPNYIEQMKALNFTPDAVMTDLKYIDAWKKMIS